MKVSKAKRDEIRRALIDAAVALFVEKGFAETSTREVAARASLAPGTSCKYSPAREQLLGAFFGLKLGDAQATTLELAGYATFSIKEKLQAFLESLLSEYLQERELVAIAMKRLVDAPLQAIGSMQPLKRLGCSGSCTGTTFQRARCETFSCAFLYFGRAHQGLQRLLQTLAATVRLRIPRAAA